ncbi:LPXTG cell wall anchor domain-containing protein, partial [Lactococcus sp. DD01]|uniref:LPXTG cell wall anchor domain-containing protein n=1 Tax=Lactococcus sp. DD01 TaxID=1776443 RepID=UPI000AF1A056
SSSESTSDSEYPSLSTSESESLSNSESESESVSESVSISESESHSYSDNTSDSLTDPGLVSPATGGSSNTSGAQGNTSLPKTGEKSSINLGLAG